MKYKNNDGLICSHIITSDQDTVKDLEINFKDWPILKTQPQHSSLELSSY